jgi:para-aminobenzoate synthetase component 2
MTRVLVVDNYDSFVYTLNGYLRQLGAETDVVRNDTIPVEGLADRIAQYDGVLVSPGPGKPADAGVSIPVVHAAVAAGIPLLGVCLGHQAIAEAFGGVVTNAEELMHGKTSRVVHQDSAIFDGVAETFTATRYHSLAVVDGTVPVELAVTARTEGGVIMALQHRDAPVYGVQFHPESVLTPRIAS